jgi:hypothetical protein
VIKTLPVRPLSILLLIATCAAASLASDKKSEQETKPALITRKQFAESNLLFSWQRDIGQGFEITQSCIRIHPSGNFHREFSKDGSKPKFAEIGKLSDSELAELKAMLQDSEFHSYRQDPNELPKTGIRLQAGYQIFSVSIYRATEDRPQDLLFFNDAKTTAEPPKVQQLQRLLKELETRKDPTLQRVTPDGCRAYPAATPPSQK